MEEFLDYTKDPSEKNLEVGEMYLIKFYNKSPELNRILLDQPIDRAVLRRYKLSICPGFIAE